MQAFCDRFAVTREGRHTVVCGPPTVETVELFLDRFHGVLEHLLASSSDDALAVPTRLFAVIDAQPEDLAFVLASCCRVDGQDAPDSYLAFTRAEDLRLAAALRVVELCDLSRIRRSLTSDPGRTASSGDGGRARLLCVIGEKFGITPASVMSWPYDQFLEVTEALADIAREQRESIEHGGPRKYGAGLDPTSASRDAFAAFGIPTFVAPGQA